jgi:hypothetical protein
MTAEVPLRRKGAIRTVAASDSPLKARADHVCDGIDDAVEINAAIEKIKITGGTVRLMGGHYYLHTTGILQRQGVYLAGEGLGATFISAATGHSLTANSGLIELETRTNFVGGGVRGISLTGDGTISGTTGRANLDATVDGIDASGATYLFNYYVQSNSFRNFRRGWNGEGCRERYVPFDNNEIWYNTMGAYCGEHPNFGMNDCRYNDVAFGGEPYDVNFRGTKICYNRVGVTGRSSEAVEGAEHCFFNGCEFFGNTEVSLILYGNNTANGCRFGVANSNVDNYILINAYPNVITGGCRFYSQVHPYGASLGAIRFGGTWTISNQITNCLFRNPAGVCFAIDSNYTVRSTNITGNIFTLNGQPIIRELAGEGKMVDCNISHNNIYFDGAVAYPVFEMTDTGAGTAGGNQWNYNSFDTSGGTAKPTCVFKGDLGLSSFCGNNLRRMVANNVPIIDATSDITGATIRDNIGWGAQGMSSFVPAAVGSTRPDCPIPLVWIYPSRPTNMIAGDLWLNNG